MRTSPTRHRSKSTISRLPTTSLLPRQLITNLPDPRRGRISKPVALHLHHHIIQNQVLEYLPRLLPRQPVRLARLIEIRVYHVERHHLALQLLEYPDADLLEALDLGHVEGPVGVPVTSRELLAGLELDGEEVFDALVVHVGDFFDELALLEGSQGSCHEGWLDLRGCSHLVRGCSLALLASDEAEDVFFVFVYAAA